MQPCGRCVACQIGAPVTCADTERKIRLDERQRIAGIVTAGISRGDLDHLRENLTGRDVRTAQLIVHALVQTLDIHLDEPSEGAA